MDVNRYIYFLKIKLILKKVQICLLNISLLYFSPLYLAPLLSPLLLLLLSGFSRVRLCATP